MIPLWAAGMLGGGSFLLTQLAKKRREEQISPPPVYFCTATAAGMDALLGELERRRLITDEKLERTSLPEESSDAAEQHVRKALLNECRRCVLVVGPDTGRTREDYERSLFGCETPDRWHVAFFTPDVATAIASGDGEQELRAIAGFVVGAGR